MPGHGVNGHAGERSSCGVGADGPGWHGSIRGAQHLKWEIYGKPMGNLWDNGLYWDLRVV
jgi:hypothetical protein